MNIMRDIQSVSEFKRHTAKFLKQIQETGEPVILTINGKPSVVVQDAKSYQELLELKERIETIAGIRRGLESMNQGRGIALEAFDAEFRKKHNFPTNKWLTPLLLKNQRDRI